MQVKTRAIVLGAIKHQEKNLIVKCFTLSDGLKSYYVYNVFSSKKNQQKVAYFQPLTLLEIDANHKNKGTLESIKDLKISLPYQTNHLDMVKSALVMFLAEFLSQCIQEEEANVELFGFIESSLLWLDQHDAVANFHLGFLMELTQYLGFYPDTSSIALPFFDLKEAIFVLKPSENTLSLSKSTVFKKLFSMPKNGQNAAFDKMERQMVLVSLLDFYALQVPGFKKPKSFEVLQTVFG